MAMEAITPQTGQLPNSLVPQHISLAARVIGAGVFGQVSYSCIGRKCFVPDAIGIVKVDFQALGTMKHCNTVTLSELVVTSPDDIKFSVSPSSKGGIEIEIGSDTIHVPKHFSAQHPLVQMLLFAELKWNHFHYPKSLAPKSIVKMFEKSRSTVWPIVYEAGWISARDQSQGPNAGAAYEFNHGENISCNNEPSLPVLFDTSTKNEAISTVSVMPQTGDDAIMLDSGDHRMFKNSTDTKASNYRTEIYKENLHSIGTSEATSSSETTVVHMVDELGETELEYQNSEPDPIDAEGIIVKTEDAKASATWVVATAATHHATGNLDLLSGFTHYHCELLLHVAGGMPMQVLGSGNVVTDTVVLPDVWYVPGLTTNLVSVSQLAELDYSVGFGCAKCYIRSPSDGGGGLVGSARVGDEGLFEVDFLKV